LLSAPFFLGFLFIFTSFKPSCARKSSPATASLTGDFAMKTSREPPIEIFKEDYEKLKGFVAAANLSPVADYLANELERARVVDSPSQAVVRLGSRVRFRDSTNHDARTVILVMPNEANIDDGRISVLTPVGAALLGLSVGQEIVCTLPNGTNRSLHVDAVDNV
jgi:regulator of nucleoside diphosphate kinase